MGKTNPTYRDTVNAFVDEWQTYRRGLRQYDRPRFDQMMTGIKDYADAGGYMNATDPTITHLISICLRHERRIDELEERLDAVEN